MDPLTTSRRTGRTSLTMAALALAGASAFVTWWNTTLMGLPDVGDPFDVATLIDPPIEEDANAFVLYRQAVAKLGPEPQKVTCDWSTADPAEKAWLERNREALELWREGTARPSARYVPAQSMTVMTQLVVINELRRLGHLAQLESSRLMLVGDLDRAWEYDRAIFRMSRHLGHRSSGIERLVGTAQHGVASYRLTRWAQDPRATPEMLRRALDAVLLDDQATRPLSDNLKVEYLTLIKSFEDADLVRRCLIDEASWGVGNSAWFAREARFFSLAKSFKQEPERSRRVIRLVYANMLAACDLPAERRPPVACSLPGGFASNFKLADLYQLDGSAPKAARALPPEKIRDWYASTLYARHLSFALPSLLQAVDAERVKQANLLIALANALYEREHGHPAETVEELVGPYLKELPPGLKKAK